MQTGMIGAYHIIFDDRNDTRKIQIDFFGNGYPNGIKGNKERIEKQFVFDVTNADEEHPAIMC